METSPLDRPASGGRASSRWTRKRVIALVLLLLFAIFVAQNRVHTTVQLLVVDVTAPTWIWLLGSAVVGGMVTWLLVSRRRR